MHRRRLLSRSQPPLFSAHRFVLRCLSEISVGTLLPDAAKPPNNDARPRRRACRRAIALRLPFLASPETSSRSERGVPSGKRRCSPALPPLALGGCCPGIDERIPPATPEMQSAAHLRLRHLRHS